MKNSLTSYNKKRDFNKTKEPRGKKHKSQRKLRFVIQHHLASKDHYDLRLEWNGVLKSWAVPKGPSYLPEDKRLAILVEDHPLAYRNFEGTIPKGEYGGGTVMLFDEGYWEPIDNFENDFKNGNFKFKLFGKRLKGTWALVQYKEDNWLLIKEREGLLEFRDIKCINTSIRSGRTMEEIAKGYRPKLHSNNIIASVAITSPNKIIYKTPKITKRKVLKYYEQVAKRMLPYLKYRLISTVRCPDGVEKNTFYKKHFEKEREGFCRFNYTNVQNEQEEYYYITNVSGLISEVQMNSIEFHVWGSTINDLESPNMMVFDLDPDEKLNLKKLREGVQDLKSILDDLKLKSYLKTSGGKGYHVVVPMKNIDWEDFRTIAQNVAKLMEAKWPDKYTSNIRKDKRDNKIFVDWVRNVKGATSVAPYSLRVRKKPTVSMPISWDELNKIKPDGITMKIALKKIKQKDPWKGFGM